MGRTSSKIKVVTGRDQELMKQLSRTGISTSEQAREYCKLSSTRLDKLEKSGYIKTSNHIVNGQSCRIIQLDKGGKEYCRQEIGTQNYCIAQTNHLAHDIKLTDIYYKLNEDVRETWRHENQIIKDYYNNNPDIERGSLETCIDATVEINGELVAIESIGDSYTGPIMELKLEISQTMGCSRMVSA